MSAETVGGNQLNAELGGWGVLIGFQQRFLQTVSRKVARCIVAIRSSIPLLLLSNSSILPLTCTSVGGNHE